VINVESDTNKIRTENRVNARDEVSFIFETFGLHQLKKSGKPPKYYSSIFL
jgi:hypothetical protein